MSTSDQRIAVLSTRDLCKDVLKAYIATSPENIDRYINTVFDQMVAECNGMPPKQRTLRFLEIMYDGLKYGNWPKELV
jgi:hypothetical protein